MFHLPKNKLQLGDVMQTPRDYPTQMSATIGPQAMVRRNTHRIHGLATKIDNVLSGLTRRLILRVLDDRYVCDQPHEGDLFDHLCARRTFQRAAVPV
jgi:hypothetical protein